MPESKIKNHPSEKKRIGIIIGSDIESKAM
jgi:hypothetical protein